MEDPNIIALASLITAGIVYIIRKLSSKFDCSERFVKQLTALVASILVTLVIPITQGQQLDNWKQLLMNVLMTWAGSSFVSSIGKTITTTKKVTTDGDTSQG